MHMLEDIESVLNFFEDDNATSSPVEGFAGDHADGPFQELNWEPEDNHLFWGPDLGFGFLEHPISTDCLVDRDEWMVHGLGERSTSSNKGVAVSDDREKSGDGIGIDRIAKKRMSEEKWVHGKSRSKRIRRVWPPQALPLGKCCSHCKAEKTPQWRMGPLGPKTLCNACGVRYKSGRLVPEYRPAASPTFVALLHSNSHRKIMRMREQRNN